MTETMLLMQQETPGTCECGSSFRREYLFRNIDPKDVLIRHVSAFCDGCNRAYHVRQRLTQGIYVDQPPGVQVITDGRKLKGILARVAHMRGDVQLSP